MLRRTEMPGAVMVQISTREFNKSILQNINNNKRSTKPILYIIKC